MNLLPVQQVERNGMQTRNIYTGRVCGRFWCLVWGEGFDVTRELAELVCCSDGCRELELTRDRRQSFPW